MSIEDSIRRIVREELDEIKALLAGQVAVAEKAEEEKPKPKRKRRTKAEIEAEKQIEEEIAEAEEKQDEEVVTVEHLESHELLKEIKLACADSEKENAKEVAKSVLSKFGVDKFADVPEDKRVECLLEVKNALAQ